MFIIKFENSTSTHKKGLPCYLSWYRLPTPVFLGFPGGSACKESTCDGGDLDSIPELGREEGMATHSSIFAWRIPKDRAAWQAVVHGVAKSWTRLSD